MVAADGKTSGKAAAEPLPGRFFACEAQCIKVGPVHAAAIATATPMTVSASRRMGWCQASCGLSWATTKTTVVVMAAVITSSGRPIAQVAKDLGINEGTLGNWVNADRRRRGDGSGALSEDERAELARLRKENAELAMERDVLKRSVALWVKDAMGR